MLILDSFEIKNSDKIEKLIMENAHADRTRTSALIDLHNYGKIYQPYYEKSVNETEIPFLWTTMQYDIHTNIKRFIKEDFDIVDLWAMTFENGEGVTPHDHTYGTTPDMERRKIDYTAVYYLKTEQDCAEIFFPDEGLRLQPKVNQFIMFDANMKHGVEPSISDKVDRISISMDIVKK